MTSLLPDPVGLWNTALDALEVPAAREQVADAGPYLANGAASPPLVRRRAHWHLEVCAGLPNYRASWVRQGFAEDDAVRGGERGGEAAFDVPADGWARLAPAVAALR